VTAAVIHCPWRMEGKRWAITFAGQRMHQSVSVHAPSTEFFLKLAVCILFSIIMHVHMYMASGGGRYMCACMRAGSYLTAEILWGHQPPLPHGSYATVYTHFAPHCFCTKAGRQKCWLLICHFVVWSKSTGILCLLLLSNTIKYLTEVIPSWNGTRSCFLPYLGKGVVYKLKRSCTSQGHSDWVQAHAIIKLTSPWLSLVPRLLWERGYPWL